MELGGEQGSVRKEMKDLFKMSSSSGESCIEQASYLIDVYILVHLHEHFRASKNLENLMQSAVL